MEPWNRMIELGVALQQRSSDGNADRAVEALVIALGPYVLRLYRLLIAAASRSPALASLMEEQMTHGAGARLADLSRDVHAATGRC